MLHRIFQAPVEHDILFTAVGDHLDLADHDVSTIGRPIHTSGNGELELSNVFGFQGEL